MSENSSNYVEVLPDPRRLIEGLRDTGYSFETAVADLVDNSIAALATEIRIWIEIDYEGRITLSIADNGFGMDKNGLINAMKYGSARQSNPRSLSKFGLGLKTASSAFARRLSVMSRQNVDSNFLKITWDLDHVVEVGKWEVTISVPSEEEINLLQNVAKENHGTLVTWEKIDRLLKDYAEPGGASARKALNQRVNILSVHLSTVYQRFLDIDDDREHQKISIWVNDNKLQSWDPFCVEKSELVLTKTVSASLENGNVREDSEFKISAYVLPRKEEFLKAEEASIARVSNDMQGFYVYRENRLIHYADWLGMWVQEPHFSLLRVEFSFDSRLDDALQVDIKKSKITLNETLYRWLKDEFLPPARRAAEERYRRGQKKVESGQSVGAHGPSNTAIGNKEKDIDQADIKIVNAAKGEVEVTNQYGKTRLILKLDEVGASGELYVKPVETIIDGMLWAPSLINGNQGIELNTSHPFYRKVYLPEILSPQSSVSTVQGIDALLWAFGISELKAVNEETKSHFSDLRYDVSKSLRKLVEHLPEPPEG